MLLALLMAAVPQAANKTKVQVTFNLTEPTYLKSFNGVKRQRLEGSVQKTLLTMLAKRVRYLEFTDAKAPNTLGVTLERLDKRNRGLVRRADFFLLTEGEDVLKQGKDIFAFRDHTRYADPVGTPAEFAKEIIARFVEELDRVVDGALAVVPICEGGFHRPKSTKMAMPFGCDDFHLTVGSRFTIRTIVETRDGKQENWYTAEARGVVQAGSDMADKGFERCLRAEAVHDDQPGRSEVKELVSARKVSIAEIFVLRSRFIEKCPNLTTSGKLKLGKGQ